MSEGHVPKKKFGQNFLTVPYYIEKIVESVPANSGDVVVEIGPGKGALSSYLVKKDFQFTMIEMDRDVIPYLKEKLGDSLYQIVNGDAVKYDYSCLGDSYHAVGNLPYNVASHIIKKILFTAPLLKSVTFMVQKEVAERICASAGGKDIGFLSILCGYFGVAEKLFDVPPGAFFPKPKIVSSVFRIVLDDSHYGRLPRDHWVPFVEFVSFAYATRRKKLSNNIQSKTGGKVGAEEQLLAAGISVDVRPEELSVADWVNLYSVIYGVSRG